MLLTTSITLPGISPDDIIELAARYAAASIDAATARRAYWSYVEASPDAPADAESARLYAAHIMAADTAATRYTTLLNALVEYTAREAVTIVGTHFGRGVVVEWSRVMNKACVHVATGWPG